MKKLIYIITCLCIAILPFSEIYAQTTCSIDFEVKVTTTPSSCQSNGTVTVTLEGDLDNIFNVQYGLSSTDGFTIRPQENNVMTGVPSGTYTVSVRAFCLVDEDYDVVKTASNVVVGGNYKVPQVTFNASSSRKSYPSSICNTGVIALNVENGSGNFTFNIVSAPAGVTLGEVVPTKSGNVYTLPGSDYPSGEYQVTVQDGECYTAVATFKLGEVSGYPTFTYTSYSGFYPASPCNYVYFYTGTVSNTNADYYRYYLDGMYEVGIAKVGETPVNWTGWTSSNLNSSKLLLDISPNSYADLYSPNNLTVYIRLKGCSAIYARFNSYIYQPILYTNITNYGCDNYRYRFYANNTYYGIFCYPLTFTITETDTGNVIYNDPNMVLSEDVYIDLNYNTKYNAKATDQNGRTWEVDFNQARNKYFNTSYTYNCDNYRISYSPNSYSGCWPINTVIKDSGGNVVCQATFISTSSQYCIVDYGETYTLEAVYPNDLVQPNYSQQFTVASPIPSAYTLSTYSSDACYEDYGRLRATTVGSKYFPVGTKFTLEGPVGFTTQNVTTSSSNNYHIFSSAYYPAGDYKLTIDHGCGSPIVTYFSHKGFYNGKELSYTTETSCSGLKVIPSGYMTIGGAKASYTYYRLTNGPTGYDKTVISPGESLTLSQPGTYTLGIMYSSSATGCAINTVDIEYTAPPMKMNPNVTSGYVCVESNKGVMILQATNGVAPYTYELWNADNTAKIIDVADQVSSDRVIFEHGAANDKYNIRVTDGCGNGFKHEMTLANLTSARIVYSNDNETCEGGTVQLNCITLGQTEYKWTGPNGFTTTTQNPLLTNVTPSMTGWYKVSVTPEFCGEPVEDQVYITVYPALAAGSVSADQEICTREVPATLNCTVTGGRGSYSYQWQTSTDGLSGWTNIDGATAATYAPPAQSRGGIYYYRRATSDYCGVIYSNVMAVTVKSCYIPINPHIRSKAR